MKDGYDLPPNAPGQYWPLRTSDGLPKAYFPEKLPPRIELSEDVIAENGRAMWALARLKGLGSEVEIPVRCSARSSTRKQNSPPVLRGPRSPSLTSTNITVPSDSVTSNSETDAEALPVTAQNGIKSIHPVEGILNRRPTTASSGPPMMRSAALL